MQQGVGLGGEKVVVVEMTSSMSSEGSSSPELELGLGLGLSSTTRGSCKEPKQQEEEHARILTAQDLPSLLLLLLPSASASASASGSTTTTSCSSTSLSCSTLSRVDGSSGSKRTADSITSPSQVVGWPPVRRAYRMNSMVNQAKSVATLEYNSSFKKAMSKNPVEDKTSKVSKVNNANCNARTFFVKVYMDRMPIGRKIDLSTQGCYETLAQTLEEMFLGPNPSNGKRMSSQYDNMMRNSTRRSKLLDGSSEFVLTYEDKDGDWMLVGDVPWGMFIASVKRLKIMRASEATGLGKQM